MNFHRFIPKKLLGGRTLEVRTGLAQLTPAASPEDLDNIVGNRVMSALSTASSWDSRSRS